MKNNYKKLKSLVWECQNKMAEFNRLAGLNTGVIEGKYTLNHSEVEESRKNVYDLVEKFLENGAQIKKIRSLVVGCGVEVADLITDCEYNRKS